MGSARGGDAGHAPRLSAPRPPQSLNRRVLRFLKVKHPSKRRNRCPRSPSSERCGGRCESLGCLCRRARRRRVRAGFGASGQRALGAVPPGASEPDRDPAAVGAALPQGDDALHRRRGQAPARTATEVGLRPPRRVRDDLPGADEDAAHVLRERPHFLRYPKYLYVEDALFANVYFNAIRDCAAGQAGPGGVADRVRRSQVQGPERRAGHAARHQRARAERHAVRAGCAGAAHARRRIAQTGPRRDQRGARPLVRERRARCARPIRPPGRA